ncbi:MAG: diguanylate cyclase, partial [Chloroflexi bacterium]|nr:diguanylate cyclase [Chloroflexota bacterium]
TDAGALGVTISIGVAELTTDTPNLLALIDRADRAMYQAKNAGGNQVALYSETPPNNRT